MSFARIKSTLLCVHKNRKIVQCMFITYSNCCIGKSGGKTLALCWHHSNNPTISKLNDRLVKSNNNETNTPGKGKAPDDILSIPLCN